MCGWASGLRSVLLKCEVGSGIWLMAEAYGSSEYFERAIETYGWGVWLGRVVGTCSWGVWLWSIEYVVGASA